MLWTRPSDPTLRRTNEYSGWYDAPNPPPTRAWPGAHSRSAVDRTSCTSSSRVAMDSSVTPEEMDENRLASKVSRTPRSWPESNRIEVKAPTTMLALMNAWAPRTTATIRAGATIHNSR